jgi:hypothetical protein
LIAALRESDLYNGLQIVVVSGHNPAQIRAGGGLPKDVPVLAKPIPFNSLEDIIEKQLVNRIGRVRSSLSDRNVYLSQGDCSAVFPRSISVRSLFSNES